MHSVALAERLSLFSSLARSLWGGLRFPRNMAKLVECVPNFSEGRKKEVIDAIADAVSRTDGCNLLDVDPGASTNRTVYTFVYTFVGI
ncbi:hypothetical protein ANANG_G00066620, partial [Anguilla anguilla]